MIYFTLIPTTRLGNWLFQYAAALSTGLLVAAYISDDALVPVLKKFRFEEHFPNLPLVKSLPADTFLYREADTNFVAFPDFSPYENVCIKGYFQSPLYFDHELVKKTLACPAESRKRLSEKYGDWLCRPYVTGISVRRGDYLKLPHRHPFCGKGYYKRCINALPECNDFIVCSDDLPWCRSFFQKAFPDKNFLFVEGESYFDSLYIHTLCENNIISNSSYSWWGAYLNENSTKKVFAPEMWYGPEYRHRGIYGRDIYCPDWIRIANHQTPKDWIVGHCIGYWHLLKLKLQPYKYMVMNYLKAMH